MLEQLPLTVCTARNGNPDLQILPKPCTRWQCLHQASMSALRAMAGADGREATSGVRGGGKLGICGRPLPADTPRIGRFHFSFWVMPSYLPHTARHRGCDRPAASGAVSLLLHEARRTCQASDRAHGTGKCCCDHLLHVAWHPKAGVESALPWYARPLDPKSGRARVSCTLDEWLG